MASVKCAWVRCRWEVKDGGEIWPLSVYPLTLGWVPDRCWEGFAPLEVEGHQDWELALWEAERVSVAVWSELIKAGAESGTVAVSRVEWTENTQSHGSLGGFPIWLNDRGIHCCSCRCCSLKRSKRLVQCQGGLVCVPHEQCWRGIRYYCNAITSPGYTVIFFF